MKTLRFAAIDIGTVTSRLLVADIDGVRVHPVARDYEVTNLGEGVDATGLITQAALERVGAAVDRFLCVRDECSTAKHPVLDTVAMSTSAARDAKNADAFVEMLKARGLSLQIVSGQREAELTFSGVSAGTDAGAEVAVVDVGGGSTEVSFGVAGEGIRAAHSFDIGCRRMTERFLHADPPTAAELDAAYHWAAEQLCSGALGALGGALGTGLGALGTGLNAYSAECLRVSASISAEYAFNPVPNAPNPVPNAPSALPVAQARARSAEACGACPADAGHAERSRASANRETYTLYAVAGTATSAISMAKSMEVYDSTQVHGTQLTLPELKALLARLAAMTEHERERVTGLDPRRAPVIVAGLLILICVMDTFGFDAFTASESDILQGMILWAAQNHGRS